jgi:hypothetical protein
MRLRSVICAIGSSLILVACGGAQKEAKTADEGNPWADYKGTYATTANPKPSDTSEAKKDKTEKKAKADKADKPAEKATEKAVAGTDEKKPASKGTIKGESVSSIGVDTLADFSKSALKAKGATTAFTLGSHHEQLKVQLKGGVTVEIIRPAAYPDPDGQAVTTPKERSGQLAKGETSWYDADADVIVVVNAAKKPAAQKVLGQLLKN